MYTIPFLQYEYVHIGFIAQLPDFKHLRDGSTIVQDDGMLRVDFIIDSRSVEQQVFVAYWLMSQCIRAKVLLSCMKMKMKKGLSACISSCSYSGSEPLKAALGVEWKMLFLTSGL